MCVCLLCIKFNAIFQFIVFDWLNNAHRRILILTLNQAGSLIPMVNFTIPSASGSTSAVSATTTYSSVGNSVPPTTTTKSSAASHQSVGILAKGKSVYFVKKILCTVTLDNFQSGILFGDLPTCTGKSLPILFDEIFFPLLNNPMNRKLWPEIVSKDLQAQTNKLQNILAEVGVIKYNLLFNA